MSQAIDVLEGREGNLRIQKNWSKIQKENIFWPYLILDDYIYRPEELSNLCYYEFVEKYEKVYKTFKEIKEYSDELTLKELPFCESHPGFEFSYLKHRKKEVLPISTLPEDSL